MRDRAPAWTLDRAAFDELLAFLDRDRETAARKYEDVRRRLVKLFSWRGCSTPEEYADRTIDRVARKLLEGVQIQVADTYQYFHGVAMNVLREHWRQPANTTSIDDHAAHLATSPEREQTADHDAREAQLVCLDRCLNQLAAPQRELLLEYHGGDRHIERRQALARSLGIPSSALRIRVHRIRATVERCVERCAGGNDAGVKHISPVRIKEERTPGD